MSWELVRVPYKFTPSYGGTIGYQRPEDGHICGGLYHTDEYLQPLWWNGGVVANKHADKLTGYITYTHAAYDLEGKDIQWDWETPTTPFCLGPKFEGQKVIVKELSAGEKKVAGELVELYRGIVGQGWKAYFEANYGVKF
ncbi:hypothetical protein HDU98_006170 [Podochytrium sp. JEL0797]|nr:hypothetical protein HDU98_006170 [Podochytrium sp. JEL0797]